MKEQSLSKAKSIAEEPIATEDSELGKAFTEASPTSQVSSEEPVQVEGTEEEKEYLEVEADDLLERGNVEEAESFYEEALELYNQALDIYKRIDHAKGIIEAHLMIGIVYRRQGEYGKAKQEFDDSLKLSEKYNFVLLKADAFTGLGNICLGKVMVGCDLI